LSITQTDIHVDEELKREIQSPGSDNRMGVSIIARPSDDLKEFIEEKYKILKAIEPDQYYYPAEDLHMTIFEMCADQTSDMVKKYTLDLLNILGEVLSDLPKITVNNGRLIAFPRACIIKYQSPNRDLELVRKEIRSRLNNAKLEFDPRYTSDFVHLSILRYIEPLQSQAFEWEHCLRELGEDIFKTWSIEQVWLATGATWYGRRSMSELHGPFALGQD
jgi:2'-5' RNA ligase